MNTQKQIEALETKLAEVSAEIQRLKGLKARQWVPEINEYYFTAYFGKPGIFVMQDSDADRHRINSGNAFPDTLEGREAAERFAFCEGFRGRWKRSADRGANDEGFMPYLTSWGTLQIEKYYSIYGLPKWSTIETCTAFIDSEGGPEKFAEILKKGIF